MTRLVLFDVDGTLVDSLAHIHRGMDAAMAHLGRPPVPAARVAEVIGITLDRAIVLLAGDVEAEALDGAVAAYRRAFSAIGPDDPAASALFSGAHAVLERLAADDRYVVGIATGKARRALDHVLAGLDLPVSLATIQTSDGHPSKPHPAMALAALDEAGVAGEDAVMVGDTTFDIEMARAAGMRALGVDWGYHPAEALHAAGAEAVLSRFDALLPALDGMWPR
ncbi:HAD family hydrolase [Rhodobacteraceae bacterium CCMM004]|nr:HAD family hydrolase [Rhodobacteraceae bacterium CCMM004]